MRGPMAAKQDKVKKCDIAERIAMDNAYSVTKDFVHYAKKNEVKRHEALKLAIAMTI